MGVIARLVVSRGLPRKVTTRRCRNLPSPMPRDSQSVQILKSEEIAPGQDGVGGQRSWPEEHEVGETVMNSTVGSRRRAEATEPAPSMSVLAVLNSKVGSHRRSAATSQLPVCRRWLGIRWQPPQGGSHRKVGRDSSAATARRQPPHPTKRLPALPVCRLWHCALRSAAAEAATARSAATARAAATAGRQVPNGRQPPQGRQPPKGRPKP